MALHDMEGFDEVMRKLLKKLPPERVLAAYKPEQVLAAYKPEQILRALPVEVLRGLSDAYLDALPEPTRFAVRARLAEPSAKVSPEKGEKSHRARRRATPKQGSSR